MALVCAHRPLPLLLASLLVLSSLLVLASLPSLVVAVAVAKPTKAQVKAEAMKAAEYIGKTYPEYANYTKYVKQYSGLICECRFIQPRATRHERTVTEFVQSFNFKIPLALLCLSIALSSFTSLHSLTPFTLYP
eukprot:TRINITY_DN1987_c0_g1_i2.p1 TRINITY_DN1987_c0_g1~~TRINITY_DN1987_c0_g1_i2.p1  ORF type:complete len:134 (-),score=5.22 TRINITY_DN1987_c0_g1_i2:898-1299(-)